MKLGLSTKLFSLLALGVAACSAGSESGATSAQNVTSVPETAVNDQGSTGNCWIYATLGWAESLHMQVNGSAVHYSPAYVFYWELYTQLMAGNSQVYYGGYWGEAANLIQKYGVVPQGAFTIDDVAAADGAIDAINNKIAAGAIPADKRDPVAVRAALDEAFNLGYDTRAMMNNVFGADGMNTFDKGAATSGAILRAQDLQIRTLFATGPLSGSETNVTLSDALGTQTANADGFDQRDGQYAWRGAFAPSASTSTSFVPGRTIKVTADPNAAPADPTATPNPIAGLPALPTPDKTAWRALFKRVQRVLNDGFPVPLAFAVNFKNLDAKGHFTAGDPVVSAEYFGGHEVLLSDYQIDNVPGYGTLVAGAPATPAQKWAALDDNASISFFRVKNSWGVDPNIVGFTPAAGYNDIDAAYFEQALDVCDTAPGVTPTADQCHVFATQLWDVVLPPGY